MIHLAPCLVEMRRTFEEREIRLANFVNKIAAIGQGTGEQMALIAEGKRRLVILHNCLEFIEREANYEKENPPYRTVNYANKES